MLPRWVALALVVGIAWQLALIIRTLMLGSDVDDRTISPPVQIARSPGSAAGSIDVQMVANTHLFGEADVADIVVVPQEDHENLAETRLSLTLKGTIASPEENTSIAIISDSRKDEKIYGIRDTVAPGATLHAIYADRVVLNLGGTLEVLKLPKEFPQSAASIRRDTTTVARTADDPQSIQSVITENVSKLADVIRPTPYYVSGEMQGFRVYPGRDRKQFAALGLRPGDLVKDIDGAALTNTAQATEIFQGLGDKDQVSVTVERDGQPEVLILSTSQLELDSTQ
ncbi:MAG: type II secretion system protein GspC [Proteobacteria bacterium]|nr:type II secretion system protein GspC [Pseudomonadota bacterium]